jgi:predicted branched-subunit amino acid permease
MNRRSRVGVRIAAAATSVTVAWLVGVIIAILPGRDPSSIRLWTLVAIGAALFVALSIAATRDDPPSSAGVVAAFALCAAFVCALSIAVVMGQANRVGGHQEGYILAIGLVLSVHGTLALGWVVDVTRRRSA